MKNSLDSERKKRKTLIAILVGVLMLLLGDCVGGIEWKAQQYLSNQYSGEFTIISSERMVNERGPIPVLVSSYYWKLTVKSTQFPSETFSVYYRKNNDNQWYWSDNYYSVLFRDEVEKSCKDLVEEIFSTECIIESVWSISPWPNGTDEY